MNDVLVDKKTYGNSYKIYEKNEFIILKVYSGNKVGFIIYNTEKEWSEGHTHINSFNIAKTIISNVIKRKKPKTNNLYLTQSHMRISNDDRYINFIEELLNTKRNKTRMNYYNRQ